MPNTGAFSPTEGAYRGVERMVLDPNDDDLVYMSTGMDSSAPGRLSEEPCRSLKWSNFD